MLKAKAVRRIAWPRQESNQKTIEMLRAVFDLSEVGITIADSHGTVLATNKAHSLITGRPFGDLVGRNMRDVAEEGRFPSAVVRAIETRTIIKDEQHHKNGRSYFVYSIPYIDSNDDLKYIISNLVDTQEINAIKQELAVTKESEKSLKRKVDYLTRAKDAQQSLIYVSVKMGDVIDICDKIARFNTTVLITGDSGCGKELLANYIVRHSLRADAPYIKINCSAIPEALLESELFGYEPGAFTNAKEKGKKGIFEIAHGGTVLLDEVGDMPIKLQPKILRFLQEGEMYHIGGNTPVKSDVRIIASTNSDLEDLIKQGKFRSDLYYRLNVVPIRVPNLAERKDDIPSLVRFFSMKYNNKYGINKEFDFSSIDYFMRMDFPGNVRELQNSIERIMMLTDKNIISKQDVMSVLGTGKNQEEIDKDLSLKEYVEHYEKELLAHFVNKYKTTLGVGKALNASQSTISRKLIYYNITLPKNE